MKEGPKFSTFSGEEAKKEDISFDQWAFKVHSALANHIDVALRESIVRSLAGVAANLMQYLGPYVPASQMVDKLELVYDMIA